MLPPIALAHPPPLIPVVSHGSQALTDTIAANSATIQPGRSAGHTATVAASSPGDRLTVPVGSVAAARGRDTKTHQAGANTVTNFCSDSLMSLFSAAATSMPIGPNNAGPPRCTSKLTTDWSPLWA